MIKRVIAKLTARQDLPASEARKVFGLIMEGKLTPAQSAALLMALKLKPEARSEMLGLARVMRQKSLKLTVRSRPSEIVLDTCGTGGKKIKTFNISTAAAFVVAASGIKVAKHGNRSFSGVCGSADVLEALGFDLDVSPRVVGKAVKKTGVGFLYAPLYHSAMRNVASVRREIGVRTIFNIVGPLTNPARASHQLMGVYSPELTEKIAGVLKDLGTKRAFVVWSKDLGDEISLIGRTKVTELKNKRIRTFYLTPKSFGLKKGSLSQIRAKSIRGNAKAVVSVLKGAPSAKLDVVLANASACLVLAGKAKTFKQGVRLARETIASGAALKKLEELKQFLETT